MNAFKNNKVWLKGIFIFAVTFFAYLIPTTLMADTRHIEFIGTFLPADQQYAYRVYTLQHDDQKWYLGVTRLKSNRNYFYGSDYNDWTALRQSAIKRLHLIGDKNISELMNNAPEICEKVKITGFLNYSTGNLRLLTVEPVERDVKLKWCAQNEA